MIKLAFALVEKKLEALKAGTLKAGRAASDPFGAWLRGKLVDIVQDKLGSTKKAATEYLQENCGSTPFDWLDGLYKDDRDAALDKFRAAHERELAAAKKDLDVLGDISL